jgi:predicted transcriptional regulator
MQSQTTTVRLPEETLAQLDELAKGLGRPRSWVIKEAVNRYLEYEVWFRQEVQKGLDAIEAGNVVSHEEAKERIRRLGIHVD